MVELNTLLRSAYRPLAEAGMKYAASHEDVESTRRNASHGECYVGILNQKIVATTVLRTRQQDGKDGKPGPVWYGRPEVITFGRFAVSPELQGQGVGARLMDLIEARAKELGFAELALDTSEKAQHLIEMYERRGFRFIEYTQWAITNYRSVVMSKTL